MIVCSCNAFSDAQVRSAIANSSCRPRLSCIYASLGCIAQCGRCAHTLKSIVDRDFANPEPIGTSPGN